MIGPITVHGKTFIGFSADSLAEQQQDYILRHIRYSQAAARIDDVPKQTTQDPAGKLFAQIVIADRTHYVLAGILTERGRASNRRDADANALRFAAITNPEEIATLQLCITTFCRGFCLPDEAGGVN